MAAKYTIDYVNETIEVHLSGVPDRQSISQFVGCVIRVLLP